MEKDDEDKEEQDKLLSHKIMPEEKTIKKSVKLYPQLQIWACQFSFIQFLQSTVSYFWTVVYSVWLTNGYKRSLFFLTLVFCVWSIG